MGRLERGLLPDIQLQGNNSSDPQNEGFFLRTSEREPRRLYEYSGDDAESPQITRYRSNLKLLQDQYVAQGLHTHQRELTNKEREVLHYAGRGYTQGEIARELYLEITTVRTHSTNINAKYGTEVGLERVLTGTILGDIDLPGSIDHEILRRLGYTHLSPREWEVLRVITEDLGKHSTTAAIAAKLAIKYTTADSHIEHIMNKLGVNKRTVLGTNVFVAFVSTGDYTMEKPSMDSQETTIYEARPLNHNEE